MAVGQRLSKVAKELNVGISTITDFLQKKGIEMDANPNTKVPEDVFGILKKEFRQDLNVRKASEELIDRKAKEKKEAVTLEDIQEEKSEEVETPFITRTKPSVDVKVVGKIDLDAPSAPVKEKPKAQETSEVKVEKKEKPSEVIKEEKPAPEMEQKAKETAKTAEKSKIDDKEEKTSTKDKKSVAKAEAKPEAEVENKQKAGVDPSEKVVKEPSQKASEAAAKKASAETKKQELKTTTKKEEKPSEKESEKEKESSKEPGNFRPTKVQVLTGPTVVGKIDLPVDNRPSSEERKNKRRKRKRIRKDKERVNIGTFGDKQTPKTGTPVPTPRTGGAPSSKQAEQAETRKSSRKRGSQRPSRRPVRPEVSEEDVAKQIKETLARLTSRGRSRGGARYRRDKRELASQRHQEELDRQDLEKKILKVTEFVTANELANLMEDVQVNQIIASCMSLGLFVSINQRLDAETIVLVAEEFGYEVEFISVDVAEAIVEVEDKPEDLLPRPPIVTVMGHVDHGKTSLLDYIRKSSVTADEAGGITQHIGAHGVTLESGRKITFLDTPGHEAFTAMRARGAQVTDIVIIIVAANDNVMPQTVEAINHASAAGVPIVFAINKIDVEGANPDKVRESLATMNYLVEEWGGKYQCQEISAKHGTNVKLLLEKVLLEADLLELTANPDKPAVGSVIESSLDKGRGYVATLLVQAGTLRSGDLILSGGHYGYIKAMFNERNQPVEEVGPSEPVLILGLNGAPQAGEKFNVMSNERETKEIATKRQQIQREQGMRAQKHITLDEIGRRIAIGNFQELNLIVKGDVDGSIEALSDSLIKLSTEEIQVNVIHKAVGGISESDIMLAAASNAIVVGFQVRPSASARRVAEKEEIDIRLYSIIYDAIEEIKSAMEGMLSPEIKEQIIATVEVRETFHISKVGTVAGCVVKEGKIKRNSKVRVIRDGIVIHTGELGSLKRFKDDVKEVATGFECGLDVQSFNDIKVGDLIEAFEQIEVTRTL